MVSALRRAVESQYIGLCTVAEYGPVKNPITKITRHVESNVLNNEPCRLSYKNIAQANPTGTGTVLIQVIKLFMAPELKIKPGSKIIVTQNGETTEYKNSGKPAIYSSHQEIILELFDGWA